MEDIEAPILSGADQSPWTSNAYSELPSHRRRWADYLSFVWRTDPIGPEARINNVNIDYAVSADYGENWQTSLGRPLRLPITQVNSETVLAVSPVNLINQCSMAITAWGGRISYSMRTIQTAFRSISICGSMADTGAAP